MARLVVLSVLLVGCHAADPVPAFSNLGPEAAFVGAAVCTSCHEDIATTYASHGMANSMYRLTEDRRVEPLLDSPIIDPHTGFAYRVIEVDGRLAQEERQLDVDGREVARLVRPMEWVVGSGNAARTYFAARGDGLVQLPLTWYTQGEGRWDFSPGYEAGNPRFGRTMVDGCMSCHNAVPASVPGVEGAFAEIPEGIGCERCHGPGSVHAEARLASDGPEVGPDLTIVNPKWLPIDLRLDVCQQCHVHATVDVLRAGETPYSYRPGRPLSAHEGPFAVPGVDEGGDGIAVVSHADRMRASACFLGTAGTERPLECVTCHDPHQSFRARPPEATSASCRSCHAPADLAASVSVDVRDAHVPEADCASCHMPRVDASSAPHASFTDHWIRVVGRGQDGLPAPEVGRSGVVAPLLAQDREGIEGGLYEGMAALTYGTRAANAQAIGVGAQFIEIARDRLPETPGEAQFLLGVARLTVGRPAEAAEALAAAVAAGPTPQRIETLARALADAGRIPEAEAAFRRAVRAQPRRPATRREFGRFWLARGRRVAAEAELKEALDLDPWDDEALLLLGLAATSTGARLEAWEEAVRLEPDWVGALARGIEEGRPLWGGDRVFGWPVRREVGAGPFTVYTTTGTPVARGVSASGLGRDGRGQLLPAGVYLAVGADRVARRFVVAVGPSGRGA